MRIRDYKVQTRLAVLAILAFIGLTVMTAVVLVGIQRSAIESHKRRVSHLVEVAVSLVAHYEKQAREGKISIEEAKRSASASLKAMRFGENDYFFVYDSFGVMVAHGTNTDLEGKSQLGKPDAAGKMFRDEIVQRAGKEGSGFVDYVYPRSKGSKPEPKLTYFRRFIAWNWIICSAVYVDDVDAEVKSSFTLYGSVSATILFMVLLCGWYVSKSITDQLGGEPRELMRIMAVASRGDLRPMFQYKPDRSSVLTSLAEMLKGLSGVVRDIERCSERLAACSARVVDSSSRISTATGTQYECTTAMAATVEEVSVAISHIADSAELTENRTTGSAQLAKSGEADAQNAEEVIGCIASTVEKASQQVGGLQRSARAISVVSAEIKEIAAQTNLLALNASIEAARAGEQGRGFAVVADEVRSLAERTANATVQIERMVQGIQADTESVVVVMDSAVPQAKQGVMLARKAAEALAVVRESAIENLKLISEVAYSTKEQRAASTNLAQQVESIAQLTEAASLSAGSATEIAGELEALSREMRQMIEHFVTTEPCE